MGLYPLYSAMVLIHLLVVFVAFARDEVFGPSAVSCVVVARLESFSVVLSLEDGTGGVGTGADTDAGFLEVSLVAVCLVVRLALRAAAFFCRGVVEFAGFLG